MFVSPGVHILDVLKDKTVFRDPGIPEVENKKTDHQIVANKPKRNVPKVDYREPEVPDDDRYIYCDWCGTEYVDACTKCGALVALKDTPVAVGTANRAKLTVPAGMLEVRPSAIHGLGVFALRTLRRGLRLGPYEGRVIKVRAGVGTTDALYGWLLRGGRLVDAADETISNWLRYVNCSRNMAEQNLVAYQYRANLYYRTCRDVQAGEELLVFYGEQFARKMGIDVKLYYRPPQQLQIDVVYFCDFCPMGFRMLNAKERHISNCSNNTQLQELHQNVKYWTCQFCKVTVTSEEFLEKHIPNCRKRHQLQRAGLSSRCGNHLVEKENENKSKGLCDRIPAEVGKCTNGGEKFVCHICNRVYSYKRSLIGHINAKHNKNPIKYHCDVCSYTTKYKGNLSRHKRIHAKVKIFICPLCKRSFCEKWYLVDHMDKHVDKAGKYRCPHCTYTSHQKVTLDRHINSKHTRHTLYKCSYCPYTSTRKCSVKTHEMYKHTHQKPFKCQECPYEAVESSHLRSHIKHCHANNIL